MRELTAIVAASSGCRGIGHNGKIVWHLPRDMAHFKKVTCSTCCGKVNAVIMGRKTWESIPKKIKPLDGRTNVVLSNKPKDMVTNEDIIVASSLKDAISRLSSLNNLGDVFIIGGEKVYTESMSMVQRVVYTEIMNLPPDIQFDVWFPELKEEEWECREYPFNKSCQTEGVEKMKGKDSVQTLVHTDTKSGLQYKFFEFRRRKSNVVIVNSPVTRLKQLIIDRGENLNPEEMQYLNLCRDIIDNGVRKFDRTGTGTLSKFGNQMKFSLRNKTLPLLTTKCTFWRGVAEELLWFIQGNTNANCLTKKNIHIWDNNGSREFLDQRGLVHREVGDLGPVYGFQWRHFGADYVDMHTDYSGQGIDQLTMCIDKIKNNPDDRRIIMSAWNPVDLDKMSLPPCHMFCQFYVDTSCNEVSCQMYQRSADMGLGVPFNIASYALLTHLVAHVSGRKPGDFIHTIGDAHIYLNHTSALQEQLNRLPRAFPKLEINKDTKNINEFVYEDLKVIGYNPHKCIKMKMSV